MDSAAPESDPTDAADAAALHAGAHGQHDSGGARHVAIAPAQQQAAKAWNKIVRAVLQTESEAAAAAAASGSGVEPAMAQVVWSTMHGGTPHERNRSGSFASRTQQNLLQLARADSLRTPRAAATTTPAAAAPSSRDWHVTFHHDESEYAEGSELRAADDERKSKEVGVATATPPFGAGRPPVLPLPFSPLHQQLQRNASSSVASTGGSVAPAAGTLAAAAARRPSFSASSPSHILRKHAPAPLAALNFLPGGLNAASALDQYPSLTAADLEDISSFLDANADDRWNYSSLFSWPEPKLNLLLQAIQPEHLTLIAHRSMREHVTSRPIDIAFRNLWYQVEERGQLVAKLRGLSGYCKPGMMVCVWGAADSGVSTFLALLAGCFQRASSSQVTGELLLNGQPLLHNLSALRSSRPQLGYVTREAENFALLTVSQTIYFSARLRLPKLPETILRFRVGLVCKLLGLSHLLDSIVGSATVRGLSGGERRRLGYACELVVGYSLILCDQPTDGLDQPTALALMQNFKMTCGAGRSMMTSLASASTELFELFDFILLLSKGACIYFGPRACVMEYLASQGFEPPRAEEIVMPNKDAVMADGDFDLEAAEPAPSLMAVPDFLQSLSATPERFWRAKLPIAVRDRPVPWLSEAFPFFSSATAISSKPPKDNRAAAAAAKYLIEVDVRRLTRMDSDQRDSPQMSRNNLSAAQAAAPAAVGIEMAPVKRQLSSHALSLDPPGAAAASALVVSQPTRRRAWKRLLKGWRASDLNADCAYVLDFDLQPIQPTLITQNNAAGPEAATGAGDAPPPPSQPQLPRQSSFLPERPSFLIQLWMCLCRQSSFVYRNRGLWLYNYLKTLVLALVMGTLFFQLGRDAHRDVRPRFGAFYFAITFYGNAAIQMISVLLSSRSIVLWESFAGYYHSMAYSLALTLVFIPVALVEMLLFSLVFYPLAGLAGGIASVSFLYFWMVFTLSNLAGRGWILLFTTFLPTQSLANIAAPVFNLLVSSFCGYLHPASSIPAAWQWMYYLSYYTYAFRGLSMNEFEGMSFECPGQGAGGAGAQSCSVVTGADALALYDITFSDPGTQKWRDLLILLAFWAVFQTLAALALLTRHYQPRAEPIQPNFGEEAVAAAGTEKGANTVAATKGASNMPEQAPLLLGPSGAAASAATAAPLLPGRAISPERSPAPCHVLSFFHLSYWVPLPPPSGAAAAAATADAPTEKLLLDDMCGVVCVGQLVALMGTSGAGKSTLLDVLAAKKTSGRIAGSIQWDGRPLPPHFERLMGYVEQFDSLAPNATVQESLFFAGRLRLPVTLSDAEVHSRVDRLLQTLELESMRECLIGSAENGNLLPPEIRKKVSIGIELMNDPQLLFLDEPTTGLNSIEALLIARLLKTLSRRLVVIATIHQPSNAVLAHFDALLLVKPPGQLAFYGNFASAARFFQDLPAHYPTQLSDVHFPALQPHDNLADVVLGALKTVAKREGEAKIRNVSTMGAAESSTNGEIVPVADSARSRSFHCREAFLQSPYAVPLLRALSHEHGKDEVAQFAASHGVTAAAAMLDAPLSAATAGWSFDPASFVVNVPASKNAAPSPSSSPLTLSSGSQASGQPQPDGSALLHWYRFRELLRRFFVSTLRAKRQFRLRFFTCCFYGFVTGTLFWQLGLDQKAAVSRLSFIYFTARFSLFSGNLKLPGVFGVRVLTARESGAGMYSHAVYALTRSLADLPWVLLEMFCFTTIVYWSAGMSADKHGALYAWSFLVMTLDRLISIGFIELVGALSSSIEMAQSVQTGANMLFMLFSGFFIAPSAIPRGWRWMQYLSPYFYVIRFLATNEYNTLSEFTCTAGERVEIPAGYSTCPVSADMARLGTKCPLQCGAEVLAIYSIPNDADSGYQYEDLRIVLLFALAYPLLAALALRSVNWIRR